jgi:hypothetical protein
MDWTVKGAREANHNPEVVVNGRAGKEPLVVEARVGTPVTLDANGTRDPDGDVLHYSWFFYPEAGTGIPGRPVFAGSPWARRGPPPGAGGIPSAPEGGLPPPTPRVTVQDDTTAKATVVPNFAGIAHVILAVEDDGVPSLTSYRRIIFNIQPAPPSEAKP